MNYRTLQGGLNLTTGEYDSRKLTANPIGFFVWSNYLAWQENTGADTAGILHVTDLSRGAVEVLQSKLAPQASAGARADMSLVAFGAGKLLFQTDVYSPDPGYGAPIEERLDMSWLETPGSHFNEVWSKADAALAAGTVSRSWFWGPTPRFVGEEAYAEGPHGKHQVLYYDKARMEVNNPAANPSDPHYVTNGLLVVEMMSGQIQTGDNGFVTASAGPAALTVAGDPRKDNPLTPDYATFAKVASLHGNNTVADRSSQPVDDAIDVNGTVSKDAEHGKLDTYGLYEPATGHNIPNLFCAYLQSMAQDYGTDWSVAVGLPITEAYWTQMRVGGKDYPVLIQAFQRRMLTYIPDFNPPWQIQQGNVGQHYLTWRYTVNQLSSVK